MFFHFLESGKETDGVMAFCAGKTEQERYICVNGTVIAGKLEQGITEKITVQVRIPSPAGIRVRVATRGGREFVRRKGRKLFFRMFSARVCMSMYSSAISRDSKGIGRNDSAMDGREDSHMIKSFWSLDSKLKRISL